MSTKKTAADLAVQAEEFAKKYPDDMEGSLALASRLEGEAKAMKEYPTMAMRTVNRLLRLRFDNAESHRI